MTRPFFIEHLSSLSKCPVMLLANYLASVSPKFIFPLYEGHGAWRLGCSRPSRVNLTAISKCRHFTSNILFPVCSPQHLLQNLCIFYPTYIQLILNSPVIQSGKLKSKVRKQCNVKKDPWLLYLMSEGAQAELFDV